MKKLILLLFLILIINSVNSATIQGSIYSWDLERIPGAIVTVDSIPEQSIVSTDGSYTFEVPLGTYTLTSEYIISGEKIASVSEEVTIRDEGKYRIDLILFPELGYEDLDELDLDNLDLESNSINYLLALGVVLIIFAFAIWFKRQKPKTKKTSLDVDEAEKVLNLIINHGGRITQKDIRKSLMMSEAKISLIITELIHKNKIEKIKKGRGNIIILKK